MRFLRGLVVGLLALAALLVAVASLLPREVTLTRSVVIAASPDAIFPQLNTLEKSARWSPWTGGAKPAFAGPREGVGNRMTWTGPDGRTESEEIITSVPQERVETALEVADFGVATSWQVLDPREPAPASPGASWPTPAYGRSAATTA